MRRELAEIAEVMADRAREQLEIDGHVVVHEDISHADRATEPLRERKRQLPVGREYEERFPSRRWRCPSRVRDDVARDVDASFDGDLKPALDGSAQDGSWVSRSTSAASGRAS